MKPKLDKINLYLSENYFEEGNTLIKEKFRSIALKEDLSFPLIKDIVSLSTPEHKIIEQAIIDQKITKRDFLHLYQQCSFLKKENLCLSKRIKELEAAERSARKKAGLFQRRSLNFNQRIDAVFKFKEERIQVYDKNIKQLNSLIDSLRKKEEKFNKIIAQAGNSLIIKRIYSLSLKEFEEKKQLLNFQEKDYLLVEHPEQFSDQVLEKLKIMGVIIASTKQIPQVIKKDFSTVQLEKEDLFMDVEHFALLKPDILDRKMKRIDIKDILEEYKDERYSIKL